MIIVDIYNGLELLATLPQDEVAGIWVTEIDNRMYTVVALKTQPPLRFDIPIDKVRKMIYGDLNAI